MQAWLKTLTAPPMLATKTMVNASPGSRLPPKPKRNMVARPPSPATAASPLPATHAVKISHTQPGQSTGNHEAPCRQPQARTAQPSTTPSRCRTVPSASGTPATRSDTPTRRKAAKVKGKVPSGDRLAKPKHITGSSDSKVFHMATRAISHVKSIQAKM